MKKIIILACLAILLCGGVVLAGDGGLKTAGEASGLTKTAISKQGDIPAVVGFVLGQATVYLGIIFFLLIVYAGLIWMTASGNESKIEKAKGILIAAAGGLVVVLSAYAIVRFVFGNVISVKSDECAKEKGECMTVEACDGRGSSWGTIDKLCPSDENFKCCAPKK